MTLPGAQLRKEIFGLVEKYHALSFSPPSFVPGKTPIPASGKVFDSEDLNSLVDASLDFWLTTGRFAKQFEKEFADFIGVRHALLTNSGSSANLLAVSAITSPKLGARQVKPGDEVITVAAGFPTTVNPIIQNNLVPVFIDISLPTYNLDPSWLDAALSPRTRAIIVSHTLGNPFDLDAVTDFAKRYGFWLIEDCCDAVGSLYKGKKVGSFGDLATTSFYPAHHITMGEGGAVLTSDGKLKVIVESFRDWGRDCWCDPGKDNTCGRRFNWQLGQLPKGFDHKYTYSHVGYNLKATDMQAAVGVSQLKKLPSFVEKRKENFKILYQGLKDLEDFFILPEATAGSEPSWFGFPISVREKAPFSRNEIIAHLEKNAIHARLVFGGNLTKQPAYADVRYRQASDLNRSDFVMNRSFWIGVYPGLTRPMLDFIIGSFHEFVSAR
ncbi:MAG: lipopolysaccharide biosynthesis protein RfbH [Candidatus Omnitrophica bacterium]|nr:lipopolysaccharide biosynthesis protein RfbH [Candidatus Omnitrophota bacterium]